MDITGKSHRRFGERGIRPLPILAAALFATLSLTIFILHSYVDQAGAYGENTTGSYSFSNGDTIQFCTTNQCSGGGNQFTNRFASGATVYVKVHTTRINAGTGYLYLYRSNVNGVPPATGYSARNLVWTQVGSDYYSSVTIPASQTYPFRIYGQIINGGNQVTFEDEIKLTTQAARFMNFYWTGPQNYPPNSADESYAFRSGATVNVMGFGAAANRNVTYTTNTLKNIVTGAGTSLTMANYARVSTYYHRYTLTLPATGLTDGQWYSINSHLMSSATARIYDMSRMILIDDSPPTASIISPAASSYVKGIVPVTGTADDTYSYYNYLLEYGAGASPSSWTTINSQTNMPPVNPGTLGNWDTTSLTDNILYTLRLTVTDRAGNPGNQSVVLRQVYVNNNPPVITGVADSQTNSNSTAISWTTDEVSDTQVRYGTSSGVYTNTTTLNPAMVTSHAQALSGLQPSTTYYCQVLSTDNSSNQSISSEYSFRTANLTVIQLFPGMGKDTYYGTGQPAWNWGANTTMSAGDMATPDLGTMRSAVYFDLSAIPTDASVVSANMSLYQMGQGSNSTTTLDLHNFTSHDWVEGSGTGSATGNGATWNTYDGSTNWTAPGGDYVAFPSVSVIAPDSVSTWETWSINNLAQVWIRTPSNGGIPNYGAIIKQNSENPAVSDTKSFYSSDFTGDPSLRPKLTIEWFGTETTPPVVGEVRAENVTRTAASIKWSTDEQADSQVEYGTTTSYGSSTMLDTALGNQHSVALNGLTEDTVYHYRVISTDPLGNPTVSGDYVFQTARIITIQPDSAAGSDTWISSSGITLNYGSSSEINAGENASSAENRRSLLKFNLASIPVGSTINSATISLYQYAQADISTPELGVYYTTGSWTEGTGNGTASGDGATWTTSNGASSWISAGGDFNVTAADTTNAPSTTADWVDFLVPGIVQDWVNGTVVNNGALIRKTSESGSATDYKSFYSSDYSVDPALRPKLAVEYVPAPGTITITVNETYNRDGSPGTGSVGFGSVNPGTTYYVGDGASPQYASKLTIKSNSQWGLKVAAAGDLEQTNPANYIYISNLAWKQDTDGPGAWLPIVKPPDAETVISTGQGATNGISYFFDYRLMLPGLAVSGSYSVPIVYTAYAE
ncbi:MAG: DNRLRE domain-containing protein [Thermoleophilia bacterium]